MPPVNTVIVPFSTLPHDSDGVLWSHVGRLCVRTSARPSVVRQSVRPNFRANKWVLFDIYVTYSHTTHNWLVSECYVTQFSFYVTDHIKNDNLRSINGFSPNVV